MAGQTVQMESPMMQPELLQSKMESPVMMTSPIYQQQSNWNQTTPASGDSSASFIKPAPPIVGKVTHHSIELYWDEALSQAYSVCNKSDGKIKSSIQEKDKMGHWCNVYTGYGKNHVVQNLEPSTQYTFRLRFMNNVENSEWSVHVIVSTTKEPMSADQLHKAIRLKNYDTVDEVLNSREVDIDVPDRQGFTALMLCAKAGDVECMEKLLEKGADVNKANDAGKTALMVACFHAQKDIVELLIEHGAKYEEFDRGGSTPIHWAVDSGDPKLIDWMINHGANANMKDRQSGWTPLLRCASVGGNYHVASALLREGADINLADNDGKTPCMVAVINKHEKLLDLFLQRNADITVKNKYGKTVYDMALAMERRSMTNKIEKYIQEHNIKGMKKV